MPSARPWLVGLTGGIASGKTAASSRLAALGVEIIDTDLLAREIVQPGEPALAEIAAVFGNSVLAADGTLDRAALRQRVFAAAEDRKTLERITHPRIQALASTRIASVRGLYAVLVVPLLVGSPLASVMDRILVIDCLEKTQFTRLLQRDGSDERTARAILAAQASRSERLDLADDVIRNDGTLNALSQNIDALNAYYRTRAAQHHQLMR